MKHKSLCSPRRLRRAIRMRSVLLIPVALLVCLLAAPFRAVSGDAPSWMHALVNGSVPAHDEKTDAVQMYSEKIVTVQSADKIKTVVRKPYKILRPAGRGLGTVVLPFDSLTKISNFHAWCIPPQGKDYELKKKDGAE